uniref:Uncharacterized protein n=1 Tax=Trypanosoma congolense (strain IL3000) TaxID=1068625 RepID=G0USB1_TRYCI|nr:conserved hypothetical protein [Trypanosoma congolense IL3000]
MFHFGFAFFAVIMLAFHCTNCSRYSLHLFATSPSLTQRYLTPPSMAFQTPWIFIAVTGVPLFMVYTKSRRMDAKEIHEIQMRVKYRSEFWEKGNEFVRVHRTIVLKKLSETADPRIGEELNERECAAEADVQKQTRRLLWFW